VRAESLERAREIALPLARVEGLPAHAAALEPR
jgi:histidinol dehydrogenase